MITRLNHVSIRVGDLSDAVEFYRDRLGFQRLHAAPVHPAAPWVEMKPPYGGPTIALMPGRPAGGARSPVLLFGTDDFEATCDALDRQGVSFSRPPHRIHRGAAVIEDPFGNRLVLTSEH
jgi:catechol 2,3-dioxygenase-like lactoylglutathione lyase family enzyme